MENKILLFNRWDTSDVKIEDRGLERYINIQPVVVPKTFGRHGTKQLEKTRINIVERLVNKMMVPGHRGKKHKLTSGQCPANNQGIYKAVIDAFEMIEKRTGKNPVQVLVKALENAGVYEEVAAYRLGGIIARKAVITSPQRRLDLALRFMAQGIYKASFSKKQGLAKSIADEIIATYSRDPKSFPIQEKMRFEKEADGAR